MLLSQFQVTPGARGEFERLTATGDVIGTLTFQAGATIYKGKAVVMQGTSPVRLSILDLEFGNTTYLAGGFIGGRQDGVGEFAGIDYAGTIATASEHAFFSDNGLRIVTFDGKVRTVAPSGYQDGELSVAKCNPREMTIDRDENLVFVEISGINLTIRRLSNNQIRTLAGNPGNSGIFDGTGPNARFGTINGIAMDSANRLWVADQNCVRLVTFPESRKDPQPEADIRVIPGITVRGIVGGIYRIEFRDSGSEPWRLLRAIVLSQPVEEFFDYAARGRHRFYRVVAPE